MQFTLQPPQLKQQPTDNNKPGPYSTRNRDCTGIPNFFEPYLWKKIGRNLEQVKSGIPNTSEPFSCKTVRRSSEKCKVYIRPTAASETAVTIAILKLGMESICLRRRNRKRQWKWLHRLQCNQSLRRRNRSVGTDLKLFTLYEFRNNQTHLHQLQVRSKGPCSK